MTTSLHTQAPRRSGTLLRVLVAIVAALAMLLGPVTAAQAADKVKMPKVVGTSAADASEQLRDLGLKVKYKATPKKSGPVLLASNWEVTKQSVKAGKKAKVGKKITLTVKKMPKASASPSAVAAAPIASGVEADLKQQWGVTNFTDGLAGTDGHDPALLNWTISSIEDQSAGVVKVTVQVASSQTSKDEVKTLARNVMRLTQDLHPDLEWVVVQTADGGILQQAMRGTV